MPVRIPCVIRFLCLSLFLAALAPAAFAGGWIGGIEFDQPSPSFLPFNEFITVTVDCYVTTPGGAQVLVKPYTDGALTPGALWTGSSLVSLGENTVTRTFSVGGSQAQLVDHVLIQLLAPDFNSVYMEFLVRVRYEFGPYGIFNIQLDQADHSVLLKGQDLVVNCNYGSPGPENVTIYARPYSNGALTPGYGASGGDVGPRSGSATQQISFHSQDADVDHIWIYMRNAANDQTLFEVFHPVDLSWRDVSITNIAFDIPSPERVFANDPVTASFDCDNQTGGDIKIWFQPFLDGSFCPFNFWEGSTPIPVGSMSDTRYFGASGPSRINRAKLQVTNDDLSIIYIDKFIPVEYQYTEHLVSDIVTWPESPALLDFDQECDVVFYYRSTDPGPIFIYAEPYFRGSVVGAHSSTGSPAYSTPDGGGNVDFFINSYSPILEADQLRFSIWSSSNVPLEEHFLDVALLWGENGTVSRAIDVLPPITASLGQNYPNPFNPVTAIPLELGGTRYVRLAVYDLRGRLVKTLADEMMGAGRHEIPFDGTGLASGQYFYRLEGAGPEQTRPMMLVK